MVGNTGGLLTPVGDPPLLLGFLNGVDFFWTLSLWPHWLLTNGLILAVFAVWDLRAGSKVITEPKQGEARPIRVRGLMNVPILAGILAAILLQSKDLAGGASAWIGQFVPCPSLHLPHPWSTIVMLRAGRGLMDVHSGPVAEGQRILTGKRSWRWPFSSSASSSRWFRPSNC